MFFLEFLNFVLCLIILFFTIIIFSPTNKYKIMKSKEEQLFLQKTFITIFFFSSILLINVLFILQIIEKNYLYHLELFIFNVYIILLVLYNFFISLELYNTYTNPVHYFNRLFRQKKYNYIIELFLLIIGLFVLLLDYIFYKTDIYTIDWEDNSVVFILMDRWKFTIIIFLSLFSIILYFKIKSKIKKFCFKNQEKLYDLINKRILGNGLYFAYGLFYGLPVIANIRITELYHVWGSIFFLIIISFDYFIHISNIAMTKFCEYRLKKTLLGYFCSCFAKPQKYSDSSMPLVNETGNEVSGMTTLQSESITVTEIISNNPFDKELVSIYKNGIFLEDFFLNFFDQILNIITSSIFQVYSSKYFSTQANNLRISTNIKMDIDVSGIPGNTVTMSTTNIGGNITQCADSTEVGDETAKFNFNKNMETDDLKRFKEVLENGLDINKENSDLSINLKSFFTQKCVECIYEQKLKGRNVGQSMLSHMILSNNAKNINPDNPNSCYWSLLAANGKEEYFNKLKNTSIKTYDKNFTLDIFDTDDEEINFSENGNNSDIAKFLDQYFTYIKGKGLNSTFIPLLVGVFKIKINNFKTLLIFITRNSLVENVPKNFFTYWQLIRFLNDKPQKIASSQFNSGTLVKDDPIFERAFQVETKIDNPDFNKISMKNYFDFQETIQSDLTFLKRIGSQNFDLLLMYYEYENTKKHEKQGAIKIRKTETGQTEFIEESIPKGALFDDEEINQGNNSPDNFDGGFLSMGGGFLDGVDELDMKNVTNLCDYKEKISINGYDGIFDSFNCMCFLTFENIFDIRKRLSITSNYYNNFQKKILDNFTEFKQQK